jgi:hypothetical protein
MWKSRKNSPLFASAYQVLYFAYPVFFYFTELQLHLL